MNKTFDGASGLLEWFEAHRRPMPWRDRPTPYRVWVSEIMLQQTRVDTVLPYFDRFINAFPDVHRLAGASLDVVLKQWEGLGYYARARNLHRAAGLVVSRHGGHLPSDVVTLRSLPGVGEYTAAAIASIGYGVSVPALDGNVLRVMTRFYAIEEEITRASTRRTIARRLESGMIGIAPGIFNQALMELGSLVCRPVAPDCSSCPLRVGCEARRQGRVDAFPVKPAKRPVPHYDIGIAVVRRRDGKILIAKRREDGLLGGLWEFPGGKRLPGEAMEETVRREVFEETGLRIQVEKAICVVPHAYSHFRITLHAFHARHLSGRAQARSSQRVRWVRRAEFGDYAFPVANRKVIAQLL